MQTDLYGNQTGATSREAVSAFNQALELIRLYRGDPIAALDEALALDPEFGGAWAVRAGLIAQTTDKAFAGELERSLRAGAVARLNEREAGLLDAAALWAEGRYADSVARYAAVARDYPRDLFAVQTAHVGCFFIGYQHELRDIPLQALRAHRRGDVGYHALLGMAAFGYEECGAYDLAEEAGRTAVEIEPRDGWAVHAVAHVYEMRGDLERGVPWLANSADHWAPESGFAYHNWWHLALLHMDEGDHAKALRLYDEKVRPDPNAQIVLEWIDASALLWRLKLEGVDVGDRFQALAQCWTRAAEDGIYAFNDLHAIMAFLGAGADADLARTLSSLRNAAGGADDNAMMTRAVGLPLAEAFLAFEAGRYGECVDIIATVRGRAQRFGGSHAQRDILTLTALHAAIRGGLRGAAEAFSTERLAHKPTSPWARRLHRKAAEMSSARAA